MKSFSIDILGRVQNFTLPRKNTLIPLFEAIVNAIHAVEDRQNIEQDVFNKKIKISIIRATPEIPLKGMKAE